MRNVKQHKKTPRTHRNLSFIKSRLHFTLYFTVSSVLPVADDKVCVSCYNPVVVSCYNQHLPGINNRTCTYTNMPLSDTAPVTFAFGLCSVGGHWESRLPCQIMLTPALKHAHMHTSEITHTAYRCKQNANFLRLFLFFAVCTLLCIIIYIFNLDAYLDLPSLVSSLAGESERDG